MTIYEGSGERASLSAEMLSNKKQISVSVELTGICFLEPTQEKAALEDL
jgi:hypothetical protein